MSELTSVPPTDEAPLHVGVLLYRGAEPLDFVGPAEVFWALESVRPFLAPFRRVPVYLVAESPEPVETAYGFTVHPTVTYQSCPPLDVLVIPGGTAGETGDANARSGRRFYEHHEPTLAFVRDQVPHVQIAASVCTGTFLLAGAGVLAGHRANTHWSARAELVAKMAARGESFDLVGERVVDDGAIVTAGGVSSGIDLALHVVDRLLGTPVRDAVHLGIELETPPVPV